MSFFIETVPTGINYNGGATMLKINRKVKIPLITSLLVVGGFVGFRYLTFVPEYSQAQSISTETPVAPVKTLDDIEYMDEVTPEICGNTPVADAAGNYQYPLKDRRDEQSYTVAKLKDGNCWMTQNMDNDAARYTSSIYGGYYSVTTIKNVCSGVSDKWIAPSTEQFTALVGDISSGAGLTELPYKFLYGGRYYGTEQLGVGTEGYYGSSSAYEDNDVSSVFYFTKSTVSPSTGVRYGYVSVRCLTLGNGVVDPPIVKPIDPNMKDPDVSVMVPNMITLDVADVVDLETASGKISEKEFVATVSSNSEYNITISATKDGHTDLRNEEGKIGSIEALAEGEELKENVSKWGLKCVKDNKTNNNANCMENTKSFVGLTDYNNPRVYFKSPSGGMNQEITFQVGIGVGSELSSGVYSTNILVTAATGN